jgi:hypothetical protein
VHGVPPYFIAVQSDDEVAPAEHVASPVHVGVAAVKVHATFDMYWVSLHSDSDVFFAVHESSPVQVGVAVHLHPDFAVHVDSVDNEVQSSHIEYVINNITNINLFIFLYFLFFVFQN